MTGLAAESAAAPRHLERIPASLRNGARVSHDVFGAGTILSATADRITVNFDQHGEKRLARAIALPLLAHSTAACPRPAPAPKPRKVAPNPEPKRAPAPPAAKEGSQRQPVHCNQCNKDWRPLSPDPRACTHCNSPYWNQPKRDRHEIQKAAGARRRRWNPSAAIDAAITQAYERFITGNDRQAIKCCASEIGWPKYRVNRRAADLGLARVKEPNWQPMEEALLEQFAHLTPIIIARKLKNEGYHRTATAVNLKMRRLQIREHRDGYSIYNLTKAFGVDHHLIDRWIDNGMLKAERRGTARTEQQGGDSFWIRQEDVRDFVFAHADEVDLRKVEKWWFLELVTDGRIQR